MGYQPLVSVVVVTYNSSKTVIKTLESIRNQTYSNIELIISDDCSSDNTIEIVQDWIALNKSFFGNCALLTTKKNTGISGNLNRGISITNGIWIKPLAADDVIHNDFVEKNISFISTNTNSDIVFSRARIIVDNPDYDYTRLKSLFNYDILNLDNSIFLKLLLIDNCLPASTAFIRKSVWEQLKGFDESIPMLEDWPFWMKSSIRHYRFKFLDEILVDYFVSASSISNNTPSKRYLESIHKTKLLSIEYSKSINFVFYLYVYHSYLLWKNYKDSFVLKLLYGCLKMLNPYFYYIKYYQYKIGYRKKESSPIECIH